MINLLPPQKKEELKQENNLKIALILGSLFFAALVSFALLLFSIKIFISGEVEAQKILYGQREKTFRESKLQTFQDKISRYNEKLSQLDSFYKQQFSFVKLSELISKNLPSGTYVTFLGVNNQAEGGEALCSVSGFAPTREVLLLLKANLEQDKNFSAVNFPAANWVESANINFSVSFKVK